MFTNFCMADGSKYYDTHEPATAAAAVMKALAAVSPWV